MQFTEQSIEYSNSKHVIFFSLYLNLEQSELPTHGNRDNVLSVPDCPVIFDFRLRPYGWASSAVDQVNFADDRAELIFMCGDYGFSFRFTKTDAEVFQGFQSCELCSGCLAQPPQRVPIKGFTGVNEKLTPVIGPPIAILYIFQSRAEQSRPRLANR